MKKLVLLFAAAAMAVSASAQVTVEGSKLTDNIYVGINGGVATKTAHHNRWLSNLNPNWGVRIGKNITPIFGIAAESNAYMNLRAWGSGALNSTAFKALNTSLLATVNANNLFAGYKGEPRAFEVIALWGMGWYHTFGSHGGTKPLDDGHINKLSSKAGLDFAFNFGSAKQWQAYVEPSITYIFANEDADWEPEYDINYSGVQLNAGLIYKLGNSNGTHNFKIAQLRDQAEIDELNRQINDLRNRKPETIVKEVVKEVPVGKEVSVSDLVFVTFAVAKWDLTPDAKKALDAIEKGKTVDIYGTASPEGNPEKNQILSENRAKVVADYLRARGVNVNKAVGEGVKGATSNRLAVVYVK